MAKTVTVDLRGTANLRVKVTMADERPPMAKKLAHVRPLVQAGRRARIEDIISKFGPNAQGTLEVFLIGHIQQSAYGSEVTVARMLAKRYPGDSSTGVARALAQIAGSTHSAQMVLEVAGSMNDKRISDIVNRFQGNAADGIGQALTVVAHRRPDQLPQVAQLLPKFQEKDAWNVACGFADVARNDPRKFDEMLGQLKHAGPGNVENIVRKYAPYVFSPHV